TDSAVAQCETLEVQSPGTSSAVAADGTTRVETAPRARPPRVGQTRWRRRVRRDIDTSRWPFRVGRHPSDACCRWAQGHQSPRWRAPCQESDIWRVVYRLA